MAVKHPGRTAAQRRALDEIGSGNRHPLMSKATTLSLLSAGKIVQCGEKLFGQPPNAVRVALYEMSIPTHMQWCEYQAAQHDKEPP